MTDIITECLPLCPVTALEGVTDLVAPYLDQCPKGANEVWKELMETADEAQQTSRCRNQSWGWKCYRSCRDFARCNAPNLG
jgi:hypothetical protein